MKTIFEFIQKINENLQIDLEKPIVFTNDESLSLTTINLRVSSLASKLLQNEVKSGELIPILIDHSPNFLISILAAWMIEAIPVPINSLLSHNEIVGQLNFLDSNYILCDESFKEKINLENIKFISSNHDIENSDSNFPNFDFNQDRTAVIIFTSGSTNKPKAVELSFFNLIQSAIVGNSKLNQTPDDRWLASLPFYHIGGFSIIFRALMFGTSIIIPQNLKIESIIESIKKFNPTLLSLVTNQMQNLLEKNIQANSKLRNVLLGGGFIDSNLMSEAVSKSWKVSKVYGSTETSSFVTYLSSEEFKTKPESTGKAIFPNRIFIMDEKGIELPVNSEGEIAIMSSAVMKGYFKNKKLMHNKINNELYFSGDYGYKDSEGYLYVTNRRHDLIVTGGENVNPIEVENVILQFPLVKEACVFGIDDAKWGQKIAALIVNKTDENFNIADLQNFLKDKIASFKIPKKIFFTDELPKTELGKVRRESIKKLFS